jgi:hypothetical protein
MILRSGFFRLSVVLTVLALGLSLAGRTQDSANAMGHVSISSPTAASLGKYGDIPVSYHTGIPQIGIPLYTVKAGPISLPVGLNYHASGLKVMEPASWVGAGWSLDAGGVITRTVMGQPDERGTNMGSVETNGHFSDYGYNNYFYQSGQEDWLGFTAGRKDGEPDLFFFNFGGYTGKFYFRDDRTPVLVPQQDLKIVPYYPADSSGYIVLAPGGGSIQAFTVTTPDGTQYFFGNTPGVTGTPPFEVTNPYTDQSGSGGTAISSWYLNKIVSADGQFTVNLSYTPEHYGYYTIAMFPVSGNYPSYPNPYEYNLVKNLVTGVRLTKISFPEGTVNFLPGSTRTDLSDSVSGFTTESVNSHATTLGAVQITDSSGFCKRYNFSYGYFTDSTSSLPGYIASGFTLFTDKQRLRLDSVQEISCDGTVNVPPHKFTYFSEQVPRRISFGQDHWGFYNGVTGNSALIPTLTLNGTTTTGANRDASWPAMRGGALHQITYPTGGNTVMDFESNDVYTSYTVTTLELITSPLEIGFDGSTTPESNSLTSDGNVITVNISNNTAFDATAQVKNSGGTVVHTYNLDAHTANTQSTITLTSGSYTVTLAWVSPGSVTLPGGTGAEITFSQPVTSNVAGNTPVGGLRVKTLTNSDGVTGNTIVTNYSYQNGGGQSTAVLYSIPTYIQQIRNDLIASVGWWDQGSGFVSNSLNLDGCPSLGGGEFFRSGGSIRPMSTVQGNHIGYGQVKVSQSGNGYSLYNYYVNVTGFSPTLSDVAVRSAVTSSCNTTTPNYPAAPPPFDYKRGELYYEQHYNDTGKLLKDKYYYPIFDTTSVLPTPAFIVTTHATSLGTQLLGTRYLLNTVRKVKMTTIEDDYDMNSSVGVAKTSTVYYGSPWHTEPTRTVASMSTGDSLVSTTQYAFDFRIPACDSISDCSPAYNTTCTACLSTYSSAIYACGSSGTCLATAYLNYDLCVASARISYDSCRRLNYINPTNAFGTCHLSAKNAADSMLKPVLRLQDEYANAPIEMSEWKDTRLMQSSFTKYDTSLTPVGFVYPGKTKLINLRSPATSMTAAAISAHTIALDSRYRDESTYQFATGNPRQVTLHDGVTSAYIWDYQNTKPIAKAVNTTASQIAYTSFEADGTGSWTVGSGSRDTTKSITGKNSYALNSDISRSGLSTGTTYIVSYWTQNGAPFTISGTITGYPVRGKIVSFGKTNNWTCWVHKVTGQSTISLTGTGPIDELRLYPAAAQMTTYTYSPLVGMTSQCDLNNRITYYEFDALARLKRIRDQDYNILKTYEYQYQASSGCGANCFIEPMQTFSGSNTLSYPVGVFNANGKLLGKVSNQTAYVSLWNSDTADQHRGTLAAGADSMHFQLTLDSGKTLPLITGCRYYQFDLPWTQLDGIRNFNAAYVDFGDSTGMRMGRTSTDTPAVIAPNTTYQKLRDGTLNPTELYFVHTYPDTSSKTITFYHTDGAEACDLDNLSSPATSLTKVRNLKGYFPQNTTLFGGSSYQQPGASKLDSVHNWSSITSVTQFFLNSGDGGVNPYTHVGFYQDFMQNNLNLQQIETAHSYSYVNYYDSTFKLSKLKTNWNTWFTNLRSMTICEDHWNRENLSALTNLSVFQLIAGNQNHSNNLTGNPIIPLPSSEIDSILIQIAAGAGQTVSNGIINLQSGGGIRTGASDAAVGNLNSKGWTITINNVRQL